jgi:hypothetical protein
VIIAFNHHVQFNRSICYILVYIFTCAFPILLGYSLWLYYLALHYLLTRGCDHLIGRCRDTKLRFARFLYFCYLLFSLSRSFFASKFFARNRTFSYLPNFFFITSRAFPSCIIACCSFYLPPYVIIDVLPLLARLHVHTPEQLLQP